jgi:hypothetical protein
LLGEEWVGGKSGRRKGRRRDVWTYGHELFDLALLQAGVELARLSGGQAGEREEGMLVHNDPVGWWPG